MVSDDSIFGTLNPPQRQAVEHSRGPLLILAGAGSGKTRALTHRIARLLRDGVQPWQILAVTFTNKAAREMKERICNLLQIAAGEDLSAWGSQQGKLPTTGTFHSICARILRRDIVHLGRDRNFVIYDTDDQEKLMKIALKELQIDEKELKAKAALGYIGRFKCEAISPREAREQATTARMMHAVQAYERYQAGLRQSNALDFDDLILECVRLFREVPDVLNRYQELWQFLHVDEYQDTNHAQYLFITLLAQKYRNLCVIGDPDQSIYAFRGADIRNILEFQKEYTDAVHIKLEQNYRSTQLILTASDHVIAKNPNRPEKSMWTDRRTGPDIILQEATDERREASEAIDAVVRLKTQGTPLREQVILYRTNAQSRLFEEACMRASLPYRIIGGVKFYARAEVKDVLAYLKVLLHPGDTISLLRILNVPSRKIGETTIGRLQEFASQQHISLWEALQRSDEVADLNEGTQDRIRRFTTIIQSYQPLIHQYVVGELSHRLLETIDLAGWLKDGTEEGESRFQNVLELLTVMQKYARLEPYLSLTSFLEEVALVSEVDALHSDADDALTLMTLHLCKGLEFESVTIAGCEEGIFPHSNCQFDKEQLEEERRLMYVGMTRAKTHLRLLSARTRMLWGQLQNNAPSRFLEDIPAELVERRSDDVLSAFAWASARGFRTAQQDQFSTAARTNVRQKVEPFRQEHDSVSSELNQDLSFSDDMNQDSAPRFNTGSRIAHPIFGNGTVLSRRGDLADIQFDSGTKKTFALSIAPLKPI